jgi:hypothetical protein
MKASEIYIDKGELDLSLSRVLHENNCSENAIFFDLFHEQNAMIIGIIVIYG